MYRQLKDEYGVFNAASRQTVLLPCDTMVVEADKLTTVYPNTMLHFGSKASEACVIIVRGQLLAEGAPNRPILFVGNVQAGPMGITSGKARWGGFQIDTLGSVGFTEVDVKYAVTAMTFIGRNSRLVNVNFVGSYGLILPGGRNYSLNPKGEHFREFDILNPPNGERNITQQGSAMSPGDPRPKQQHPASRSKNKTTWLVSSLAVGALAAGGAATYVWWVRDSKTQSQPPDSPPDPESPDALQSITDEVGLPGRAPRP